MAITKVSRNLLNTGVSDGSDATAITIASDEKVGIGETNPQFQMLTVKSSSATGNNLRLTTGSELATFTVDDSGDLVILAHGADERIKFLNGVGSGTSIAAFDSHGLKFGSDTAAANALDDYEEGTWTPTVGTGTITVVSNTAEYTKIGDMVFAQARITNFSSTSTNQIILGGLPYSVGTAQSHIGTAWGNFGGGANRPTMFFYIGGGAYYGGTSFGIAQHNSVSSATHVIISLIYRHG